MKEKILELLVKSKLTTIEEMDNIKKYLDKLEDNSKKLYALEAGGVDNWQWYGEALQEYYDNEEE